MSDSDADKPVTEEGDSNSSWSISSVLLNRNYWFLHFAFVVGITVWGIYTIGDGTYSGAPPLEKFVSGVDGHYNKTVISLSDIHDGQEVFLQRGFMSLGSFWGDGAERGPDFTADALHQITESMTAYYTAQAGANADTDGIKARVAREVHINGYDESHGHIALNEAQVNAINDVKTHFVRMFTDEKYPSYIRLGHTLNATELDRFGSYLYWGAWVSTANRPDETYSYTHNWPFDPAAGNHPTPPVYLWSIISIFVLFVGIMFVLYVYGQIRQTHPKPFNNVGDGRAQYLTTVDLEKNVVRPTQRTTYWFFAMAVVLFGFQVLAGIMCASDFVRPFGIFLGDIIPFSVLRSYHTLVQIFWFFMCWVGYTIFFLPRLSRVPTGQSFLIKLLLFMCVVVALGVVFGIYAGHTGLIKGATAYWFGSQGWEFMELGRFFHLLLLAAFSLWILIIFRAVRPWLTLKNMWSVPSWLLYGSGIMVMFLFFGLAIQPRANFAVANFWRWMVVHMWVEVTFEVFTTVIVAYMMVQMNYIDRRMAENTIFLAVMMFIFTATIGIAHNFYWIAKPTSIVALGSTFSTTQVLPLLLLTLDAAKMWRDYSRVDSILAKKAQTVVMGEVWMYLLAVNFWNIFGAGVFGSLINLPIVNYFEHATYLTNNHAHGAMFGVKGNVALAGMLYCCQHLFPKIDWDGKMLRRSFWCFQIGIAMMMFLDLFPVGLYQVYANLQHGFWYARSHEIVQGSIFRGLTYMRSFGGMVFVFGGLIPLIRFVLSNMGNLLPESKENEVDWPTYERNWAHSKTA